MKNLKYILMALSLVTISAHAADYKEVKKTKRTPASSTVAASNTAATKTTRSDYAPADSEVDVNLGFTSSAVNLGASYERIYETLGLGGYLFVQTDKDKNGSRIVNSVTSIGAYGKLHLLERSSRYNAYIAPGFGLHIVETSDSSNRTTLGPVMKVGGQVNVSPTVKVGVEALALANWFDDSAPAYSTFYDATLGFTF